MSPKNWNAERSAFDEEGGELMFEVVVIVILALLTLEVNAMKIRVQQTLYPEPKKGKQE